MFRSTCSTQQDRLGIMMYSSVMQGLSYSWIIVHAPKGLTVIWPAGSDSTEVRLRVAPVARLFDSAVPVSAGNGKAGGQSSAAHWVTSVNDGALSAVPSEAERCRMHAGSLLIQACSRAT